MKEESKLPEIGHWNVFIHPTTSQKPPNITTTPNDTKTRGSPQLERKSNNNNNNSNHTSYEVNPKKQTINRLKKRAFSLPPGKRSRCRCIHFGFNTCLSLPVFSLKSNNLANTMASLRSDDNNSAVQKHPHSHRETTVRNEIFPFWYVNHLTIHYREGAICLGTMMKRNQRIIIGVGSLSLNLILPRVCENCPIF